MKKITKRYYLTTIYHLNINIPLITDLFSCDDYSLKYGYDFIMEQLVCEYLVYGEVFSGR